MSAEPLAPSPLTHFDPAELLDALSTGIVMLDEHLCVVYANVGAQDLLSFSLNQSRGRPIQELFPNCTVLRELLRRSLDHTEPCAGHEIELLAAGAQAPREPAVIDITVTPLEGEITGTHLLLELADARVRQRISRESEILSRLDGSRLMIRQLAHEIKNPLGGLRGAAQLLERELREAALKEYTAVIINEADRLCALVDSMLGPARARHVRGDVNIHEICEHVFQLLRSEAPVDVVMERDYDPSLPSGAFDRNEIIQAVLNVGRNALQALPPRGGRVLIRTRALSNISIGTVRHRLVANIEVQDNGHGVPPELRSSLFYPLVTGRPNGSGLGLAVAQELIARHRGLIEFESQPSHTVFSLLLPLETNGL
jgi:two-component system, NtrC family, nitrogen regulation sensor histidine kinase GlnL